MLEVTPLKTEQQQLLETVPQQVPFIVLKYWIRTIVFYVRNYLLQLLFMTTDSLNFTWPFIGPIGGIYTYQ